MKFLKGTFSVISSLLLPLLIYRPSDYKLLSNKRIARTLRVLPLVLLILSPAWASAKKLMEYFSRVRECLLVEYGFRGNFAGGIGNPRLWNPENSSRNP